MNSQSEQTTLPFLKSCALLLAVSNVVGGGGGGIIVGTSFLYSINNTTPRLLPPPLLLSRPASCLIVLGPLAALGHLPVDVLVGRLDIARLAVDATGGEKNRSA